MKIMENGDRLSGEFEKRNEKEALGQVEKKKIK